MTTCPFRALAPLLLALSALSTPAEAKPRANEPEQPPTAFWEAIKLPTTHAVERLFPVGANGFLARDEGGNAFLSRDAGASWLPVGEPGSVSAIFGDERAACMVSAGAVSCSRDGGVSWTPGSIVPRVFDYPRTVFRLSSGALMGFGFATAFTSVDDGLSWTVSSPSPEWPGGRALEVAPGVLLRQTYRHLARSVDGGKTITRVGVMREAGARDIVRAGTRLFATEGMGVALSDDDGLTWRSEPLADEALVGFYVTPKGAVWAVGERAVHYARDPHSRFVALPSGYDARLWSIAGLDEQRIVVGAEHGVVLRRSKPPRGACPKGTSRKPGAVTCTKRCGDDEETLADGSCVPALVCPKNFTRHATERRCEPMWCPAGQKRSPETGECESVPCPAGRMRNPSTGSCDPPCAPGQKSTFMSGCVEVPPEDNSPNAGCDPGYKRVRGNCRRASCPEKGAFNSVTDQCELPQQWSVTPATCTNRHSVGCLRYECGEHCSVVEEYGQTRCRCPFCPIGYHLDPYAGVCWSSQMPKLD